jgi:AcrR family transcriptional regulator
MARKRRSSKKPAKKAAKKTSRRATVAQRPPRRSPAHRTRTSAEPRADRRNLVTHTAVIAAARRLVRQRGYNRVTIEAIAAEAGAGKQTIYRWWPSKAALFFEVYAGLVAEADLRTGKGRLAVELRGLLLRLFRVHSAKPVRAILAGLLAEAPGDHVVAKAVSEVLVRRQRQVLRPLLLLAQKRGEIRRTAEPNAAADAISAALWFRLLLGQGPLNGRFAERLTAQTLKGIAGR